MTPEQADALQRIVEFGELQTALDKIDELRSALACEMDDTRNACGDLNREIDRLRSRLADAEALLRTIKNKWPYWAEIDRIDAFLGDKP